jgi:hypothetical protein
MFFARLGWKTIHVEAPARFMPLRRSDSVMRGVEAAAA